MAKKKLRDIDIIKPMAPQPPPPPPVYLEKSHRTAPPALNLEPKADLPVASPLEQNFRPQPRRESAPSAKPVKRPRK